MTEQFTTLPPLPPTPVRKNWFARHKVLTGLGAVVLIAGVGTAAGSGGGDSQTAAQQSSPTNATAPAGDSKTEAKAETNTDTKSDSKPEQVDGRQPDGKTWLYGDWKISNVKVSNTPSIDWFKVTADATYLGEDNSGGDKCFNLALDKGSRQVTSGMACVNSLQPGKTASIDFSTTDNYVPGPYDITITKTW